MAIIRTVERRSKHVSIIYIVCMLLTCSGSWRHWVQKCGFLYSCLYIVYFILPALSGSSHPSPSVGWQPGYIYYDHRGNKKCDQTCANHFLYPHSWARLGAGNRLRASNGGSRRFHNHGEGPYHTLGPSPGWLPTSTFTYKTLC